MVAKGGKTDHSQSLPPRGGGCPEGAGEGGRLQFPPPLAGEGAPKGRERGEDPNLNEVRIALAGVGRMGSAIAERLRAAGHELSLYDVAPPAGVRSAPDLETAARNAEAKAITKI